MSRFHRQHTLVIFVYFALCGSCLLNAQAAPKRPFPAHQPYPGAAIHVNSFTQAQQDADVRAAYDSWKMSYLVSLGTTPAQYRIAFGKTDPGHARTVSEGQGYGMVNHGVAGRT